MVIIYCSAAPALFYEESALRLSPFESLCSHKNKDDIKSSFFLTMVMGVRCRADDRCRLFCFLCYGRVQAPAHITTIKSQRPPLHLILRRFVMCKALLTIYGVEPI